VDSVLPERIIELHLTDTLTLEDTYRRIINLGNLLVNMFAKIVTDDISDTFDVSKIIGDDISNHFGSNFG